MKEFILILAMVIGLGMILFTLAVVIYLIVRNIKDAYKRARKFTYIPTRELNTLIDASEKLLAENEKDINKTYLKNTLISIKKNK